jgi:hypothetical protein
MSVESRWNNPEWVREYRKEYRRLNIDRDKKNARKWRAIPANQERSNAAARKRWTENPGKYRENGRKRYAKDLEKSRAYKREWMRKQRTINREKHNEYRRKYRADNRKKVIGTYQKWIEKNRDRSRTARKKWTTYRLENDPAFKVLCYTRNRINEVLRGARKCNKTKTLLGTSVDEVKRRLQSQFHNGMTWENYGANGWHIDHIIPCVSFDLTDPEQQKQCFHYTNLQPLWWYENLSKGANHV